MFVTPSSAGFSFGRCDDVTVAGANDLDLHDGLRAVGVPSVHVHARQVVHLAVYRSQTNQEFLNYIMNFSDLIAIISTVRLERFKKSKSEVYVSRLISFLRQ